MSRMRHTLIAWVLMVAAGGEGYQVMVSGPAPVAVFLSAAECDIARGKKITELRKFLQPPIRSGYDYIEGGAISDLRAPPGRQLYILTCESTSAKGR